MGDTDNKYLTDQAKASVSVSGATAHTTTLPNRAEPNIIDQAKALVSLSKATACTTTLPDRAEPKNTKLVTQDNKTRKTRTTVEVD